MDNSVETLKAIARGLDSISNKSIDFKISVYLFTSTSVKIKTLTLKWTPEWWKEVSCFAASLARRQCGLVVRALALPCIRNPRPQCARQSKPCYPVNHLPFHRKQGISVFVDLSRRKDATKVFIREVSTTKYIINMVLPSSYTWFENASLNSS